MTEYLQKRDALSTVQPPVDVCRQRIDLLLDPDSFVELDSLVESRGTGLGFNRPPVAGDGVVTGYGTINNRMVYLAAQDPAVYGGSMGRRHAEKICKTVELAQVAGVPFIGLYDSGGVRIEEGVGGLEAVGQLLANLKAASGAIPLLAAIFGHCAGSAAFVAAASDFVLMTEKKAGIFVNGPGVIAAVENQALDAAAIGGGAVHARSTGLAAFVEADAPALAARLKTLLDYLPDAVAGSGFMTTHDDPNRSDLTLDELAATLDDGYDVRTIIAAIVDQGSFLETAAAFAPGLVTGLAFLDGQAVGMLAATGARLDADMAAKAVRLTDLCDRFGLPLITLADAPGFAISSEQEQNGLAIAGAAWLSANLQTSVPRITIVTGKVFGPAYLALASKNGGADLVYAWPTAELAAVAPDTAAHIIFRKEIAAAADPMTARSAFIARYAGEVASPYAAAAEGLVDEIIRPAATRPRLISALMMLTAASEY